MLTFASPSLPSRHRLHLSPLLPFSSSFLLDSQARRKIRSFTDLHHSQHDLLPPFLPNSSSSSTGSSSPLLFSSRSRSVTSFDDHQTQTQTSSSLLVRDRTSAVSDFSLYHNRFVPFFLSPLPVPSSLPPPHPLSFSFHQPPLRQHLNFSPLPPKPKAQPSLHPLPSPSPLKQTSSSPSRSNRSREDRPFATERSLGLEFRRTRIGVGRGQERLKGRWRGKGV